MNALTVVAIANAAIAGLQSAVEAWPYVKAMFVDGHVLNDNEQAIVDRAADDAHALLQGSRTPAELGLPQSPTAAQLTASTLAPVATFPGGPVNPSAVVNPTSPDVGTNLDTGTGTGPGEPAPTHNPFAPGA